MQTGPEFTLSLDLPAASCHCKLQSGVGVAARCLASADVLQVLCSHKALLYSKSLAPDPSSTAEGLQVAGEFLECALVSRDVFGFRKS